MKRFAHYCAVAALLFVVNFCPARAEVRPIALYGDNAPNALGPGRFTEFGSPLIDDTGKVTFPARANVNDMTALSGSGAWTYTPATNAIWPVVFDQTPAAGTVDGALYECVTCNGLFVSRFGQLLLQSKLSGPSVVGGINNEGVWVSLDGEAGLQKIARAGDPAPSNSAGEVFLGSGSEEQSFSRPYANSRGEVAFSAWESEDESNGAPGGVWTTAWGGGLNLVLENGDYLPGSSTAQIRTSGAGRVYDDGRILMGVSFRDTSAPNPLRTNADLLAHPSGAIEVLFREGDIAPGVPIPDDDPPGEFRFYSAGLSLGDNDSRVIVGDARRDDLNRSVRGIWSDRVAGEIRPIALTGAPAEGTSPRLDTIELVDVSEDGLVAFVARLNGVADDRESALVAESPLGGLRIVAQEGDAVPGVVGDVRFGGGAALSSGDEFLRFSVNNDGRVAFLARVTGDDAFVPTPSFLGSRGIWAEDANGVLQLIAISGGALEVAPGDVRIVNTLDMAFSYGAGLASAFNDRGELVFAATFTDGSEGIFFANVAVPEPVSGLLCVCGIAGLLAIGLHRLGISKQRATGCVP